MNKLFTAIQKSIKILLRSKGSAMIVLLGPLLIVLIVGAGFYDSTPAALNIGVYSQGNSNLTQRFVKNLDTPENNIIQYTTESSCIDSIKQGLIVTCISFPENFVLEDNKTNKVKFYVDESRVNLVYKIISSLSFNLDVESGQVSQELTSRLLQIMVSSSARVDETLNQLGDLSSTSNSAKQTSEDVRNSVNNLDAKDVSLNFGNVSTKTEDINYAFKNLRDSAKSTVESGHELLNAITYNGTEVENLKSDISYLDKWVHKSNSSVSDLDNITSTIINSTNNIELLQRKLENTRNTKANVLDKMYTLSDNINKLSTGLSLIIDKQKAIQSDINSFKFRDARSIVNPISTKIEPVSSSGNKITFSFPYLLMLIVMFVGMMLSGTLIFMEKDSRAFFRNFTAPVKDIFFFVSTFLTSFFIVLVQTIVIVVLVALALHVPLFSNLGITAVTIFLSMTAFILLGMLLGYLFNTSEAIMMSTIALGSVMIFFSNLILPLETLAPIIQSIARLNPYVVASETIRKAMLFGAGFDTVYTDILILLVYCVAIIILIMIVKQAKAKKQDAIKYFRKEDDYLLIPEEKQIHISHKDLVIKDVYSLLDAFRALSDSEYLHMKKQDIFGSWIEHNLKNKKLASAVRKGSRKKSIDAVLKYLNR